MAFALIKGGMEPLLQSLLNFRMKKLSPSLLMLLLLASVVLCRGSQEEDSDEADNGQQDEISEVSGGEHYLNHSVETIAGLLPDTTWLILDGQWILLPCGRGEGAGGQVHWWECRYQREAITRCPFKLTTVVTDDNCNTGHKIIHMRNTTHHTCRQDITHVIDYKFRTKIKQMAMNNFKFKYAQTFEKEKRALLTSINDQNLRERVRQVLPSQDEFRSAANRAKK